MRPTPDLRNAVLIVVDVQKAIDAEYHAADGPRNNPGAESVIATLLGLWRRSRRSIVHIRHDSLSPTSAYRPDQEGNEFKAAVAPLPGEVVIAKRTNSAFIGTNLEKHLRDFGLTTLIVTGVSTNNSVEATVRMAGNLGFNTYLVEDACFTFGRRDFRGQIRSAEDVHAMSLANLDGEYCTILTSESILRGWQAH